MRIFCRVLACVVAAIVLLFLTVVLIRMDDPWSELACTHEEIDIVTGRVRITTYRAFCKTSENIQNSELTEALLPEDLKAPAQWRRVNTFAPGLSHSPHYRFHGAFAQIPFLRLAWASASVYTDLLPEFKRATARHLFALWQEFDGDDGADNYLRRLADLARESGNTPGWIEKVIAMEMPSYRNEDSQLVQRYSYPCGKPLKEAAGYRGSHGEFVAHGIFAEWDPDANLESWGRMEHGKLQGVRFDSVGEPEMSATEFKGNTFSRWMDKTEIVRHPDYPLALATKNAGQLQFDRRD
jgi:hypothetical protein